ncbi:hypothetical protein L6R53_17830 [Myxococcota bacterium]|nr:hypothetical protein [Myxococcota bacterium]
MPAPRLCAEQAALVARGECGCGCGRELPTLRLASGEVVVDPRRCYATVACRKRASRLRARLPDAPSLRAMALGQQAAELAAKAARAEARARRLVAQADRDRRRARRMAEAAGRA